MKPRRKPRRRREPEADPDGLMELATEGTVLLLKYFRDERKLPPAQTVVVLGLTGMLLAEGMRNLPCVAREHAQAMKDLQETFGEAAREAYAPKS